jgi:hypothetical protein
MDDRDTTPQCEVGQEEVEKRQEDSRRHERLDDLERQYRGSSGSAPAVKVVVVEANDQRDDEDRALDRGPFIIRDEVGEPTTASHRVAAMTKIP